MFKAKTWWIDLFKTHRDYVILHLHRPVNIQGKTISALPSILIYKVLSYSVQEIDEDYDETQRYVFQANGVIPLEIWLSFHDLWNYQRSRPHYVAIRQAQRQYKEMMEDSIMQNSQKPDELSTSKPKHKWKSRSERQRQLNIRRNHERHQDWIKEMNITDPDSTPSDTPSDPLTDYGNMSE